MGSNIILGWYTLIDTPQPIKSTKFLYEIVTTTNNKKVYKVVTTTNKNT